jgi:sulfatase maturation enzyme AslB (radical SAM superfamily)
MSAQVAIENPGERAAVEAWCRRTRNTLISVDDQSVEVKRGISETVQPNRWLDRALARLRSRLWLYTNFDCNLACDYCCVRSAPGAPRRALGLELIGELAGQAGRLGIGTIFLTGGEPFLLGYIDEIVRCCTEAAPTVVLTNGMLFRGRRRDLLESMPPDRLTVQVSLDSPGPERHDRHRGRGSWRRALEGIEVARGAGFRVRVAATLTAGPGEDHDEQELHDLLDRIGIGPEDRVLRRLARRGRATHGITIATDSVLPELTYTDRGVFWHPVGADDPDMLIAAEHLALANALELADRRLTARAETMRHLAGAFPCA